MKYQLSMKHLQLLLAVSSVFFSSTAGYCDDIVWTGCLDQDGHFISENGSAVLEIITLTGTVAGIPQAEVTSVPVGFEFAVAPLGETGVDRKRALRCRSDSDGHLNLHLPSGRYWIGALAILQGEDSHHNGSMAIKQVVIELTDDRPHKVRLMRLRYAP